MKTEETKKWIQGMRMKKGALDKLPAGKGGQLAKRARLAIMIGKLRKK